MEDLQLDLAEAQSLLDRAKRPTVIQSLKSFISKTQSQIENLDRVEKAKERLEADALLASKMAGSVVTYTGITSYAWDQTDSAVKIFISLTDVHTLPESAIKFESNQAGFILSVHGLAKENFRLKVTTAFDIVPEKSSFKVKDGRVTISLGKAEKGKKWDHLTQADHKKAEFKTPSLDKDADPQESIMNMMKKMYDEGDDDMKRTITKAWTESREKQGAK